MKQKRILVVDDEPEIVKSLERRLTVAGYEVVTAYNGVDAVRQALDKTPDLVLLDISMPGGSGHLAARRLRDLTKLATTPIIYLTARTDYSDYQEAAGLGVQDYLTKPFDPKELLMVVERNLAGVNALQKG